MKELPKNWKIMDFDDCIKSDSVPSKIKIKLSNYKEPGRYPIIDQGKKFIAGYSDDISKVFPFKGETVIFGDHTRIVKYVNFPFCVGADGTKVLIVKDDIIIPKFFYFQLKQLNIKEAGYSRHYRFLKKRKIIVPPINVQKQIVTILERAEKLKESRKHVNEETNKIIQSIFYEMFGTPSRNKKRFPIESLNELCSIQSGGTPSRNKKEYWENGTIPWLSSTVCKNGIVKQAEEYITEAGLKNSSAKWFKECTVLIALVGATIGKTAFLKFRATCNQNIAGLYPKNLSNLNSSYLFYACQNLYPEFLSLSSNSFKMANLTFIRNLRIPVPPIELQNQFASIAEKIESMKNKQQKSTEEINQLYNALMQKAFNGELVN